MGKLRHEIGTFMKAELSALVATMVDYAVSIFLAEVCSLWYVWASFLGAVSGGVTNCVINYRWVFTAAADQKKGNIALKYLFVWTGSILLNTGGTYVLTEISGQYFVWSKIVITICVALFWNYQLQRFFVYGDVHLKEKIMRLIHKK